MGLVTEVVEPGEDVSRALARAQEIAAFPRDTTNSDRRAVLDGEGLALSDGLALEAALGRLRIETALEGARRFKQRNS